MAVAPRPERKVRGALRRYYRRLWAHFGPQHWWPGDTRFEVILGALLTQNTSWRNVEKALGNLRRRRLLSPRKLGCLPAVRLSQLLRPSGFYRQKTRTLRSFLRYLEKHCAGSLNSLFRQPTPSLRAELLSLPGVGPETADSILLYAGQRPVFVIDGYTRRVLDRHGLAPAAAGYAELQHLFQHSLPRDPALYNEYHALLVAVGKTYCHRQQPNGPACPLGVELEGRHARG